MGFALATMALLHGNPSEAGPWAREAGDVFLSFGVTVEGARNAVMAADPSAETVGSAYAEWGLGHRLTAGFDLSYGESSGIGSLFLRRTLTDGSAPVQAAVDIGVAGLWSDAGDPETLLRLGASIGRGFGAPHTPTGIVQVHHMGGWTTFDATVYLDSEGEVRIWQVEGVLGLRLTERWSALMGVKAEEWAGSDTIVTARPSVLYDLGRGMTAQGGVVAGLSNSDVVGLSVSLWHEF